jgi:imidazolonepropionase
LIPGQRADFVAWPLNHPNELSYWLGPAWVARRIVAGREVTE